jgi:hypothetical protein
MDIELRVSNLHGIGWFSVQRLEAGTIVMQRYVPLERNTSRALRHVDHQMLYSDLLIPLDTDYFFNSSTSHPNLFPKYDRAAQVLTWRTNRVVDVGCELLWSYNIT